MSVLVVGASGRTGARVVRLLLGQGQPVRATVRRRVAAEALGDLGAEVVHADLEEPGSLPDALSGVSAVVCAAGAGVRGDPEAVDHRGTVRLITAAEQQGAERFILISSLGTPYPDAMPALLRPYLRAKRRAEEALEKSALAYTILRPGGLTDSPGTGRVTLDYDLQRLGSLPRDDLAALCVAVLLSARAQRATLEVIGGDTEIARALAMLAG